MTCHNCPKGRAAKPSSQPQNPAIALSTCCFLPPPGRSQNETVRVTNPQKTCQRMKRESLHCEYQRCRCYQSGQTAANSMNGRFHPLTYLNE
jgi:hypothetical protein